MKTDMMKRNYEDLIGAIVQQCAIDYRFACRHMNDRSEKRRFECAKIVKEVEMFLTGDWLPALSGIDGEYILNRLREESNAA